MKAEGGRFLMALFSFVAFALFCGQASFGIQDESNRRIVSGGNAQPLRTGTVRAPRGEWFHGCMNFGRPAGRPYRSSSLPAGTGGELQFVKFLINAAALHKFVVLALLHDFSLVQNHDDVRV